MSTRPDLSVVIPVHNAAATVGSVVAAVRAAADLDVEVIVVDDGSEDGSADVVRALEHDGAVVARYLDANRGAGHARNIGFELATGRYTLFFDADDRIHMDAVAHAVEVLDRTGCPVALCAYRYHRAGARGVGDMNVFDRMLWDRHVGAADARVVELEEAPRLLGFSNYPWNKILRTEPSRQFGLRFGSTPVHNDILGHWMTMLGATRLALVNAVVCTHEVTATGNHLTNRSDRARLTLFDALDETYDFLASLPHLRQRYAHLYWDFVLRISSWAEHRLEDDLLLEYRRRRREHLMRMDLADFAGIRVRRDPALGARLVRAALA
jgi:glycosyltransferase involved in cell wall biosynthesis